MQVSGRSRKLPVAPKPTKRRAAKARARDDGDLEETGTSRSRPPPSTNVSSPARGRTTKKLKTKARPPIYADSDGEDGFGNNSLDFDVDDDDMLDLDAGVVVESDDGFEPLPPQRIRKATRGLGPRISQDERLANLDVIHQDIVYEFVREAKMLEEGLRNQLQLRKPLFSETIFREMAISWTRTLDQMESIPDIDMEKVRKYGRKFLPLVEQSHTRFLEITCQPTEDPITISDDEDERDGSEDDEEKSKFFVGQSEHLSSPVETEAPANRSNGLSRGNGLQRAGSSPGARSGKFGGKRAHSQKASGGFSRRGGRKSSAGVTRRKTSGSSHGAGKRGGGSGAAGTTSISRFMHQGGKKGGGSLVSSMPV